MCLWGRDAPRAAGRFDLPPGSVWPVRWFGLAGAVGGSVGLARLSGAFRPLVSLGLSLFFPLWSSARPFSHPCLVILRSSFWAALRSTPPDGALVPPPAGRRGGAATGLRHCPLWHCRGRDIKKLQKKKKKIRSHFGSSHFGSS